MVKDGLRVVCLAWTKAWAIMKWVEIPDTLPPDFVIKHKTEPNRNTRWHEIKF
jgi:hypothetical protein